MKSKILFVCMGNICRSPTAEGVVRAIAARQGMAGSIEFDSAGTHGYHIDAPPDKRASAAAACRGYDLSPLRARQVNQYDFLRFDRILAMDRSNLALLVEACPAEHQGKLGLLLDYARNFEESEVPDPYYGGPAGFELVLDMVEDAAAGLLEEFSVKQKK